MLFSPADQSDIFILRKEGHLVDGNRIEFFQPFRLRDAVTDEMGVEVFKV